MREKREPLPDRLKPLLGECWAMYELLRAVALTPAAAMAMGGGGVGGGGGDGGVPR